MLQWSPNGQELASGSNDNRVLLWHAGISKPQQIITEHTACVKALAWSPHQTGLLATGAGSRDRRIVYVPGLRDKQSLQRTPRQQEVPTFSNAARHAYVMQMHYCNCTADAAQLVIGQVLLHAFRREKDL